LKCRTIAWIRCAMSREKISLVRSSISGEERRRWSVSTCFHERVATITTHSRFPPLAAAAVVLLLFAASHPPPCRAARGTHHAPVVMVHAAPCPTLLRSSPPLLFVVSGSTPSSNGFVVVGLIRRPNPSRLPSSERLWRRTR
jgi:hypothetical protein